MLMSLLIFLLVSNAVTLSRDKSMLFSRIVIQSLIFVSLMAMNNLYMNPLEKGMGIYGGLFNVNVLTQTFNIFMLLVTSVMLVLTGFFPSKVYIKEISSSLWKLLTKKFSYNKNLISNKNGEQFRSLEYSLMMVFSLCGSMFLMSTGDLMSVFLCMELQSYSLYMLSTLYSDSESATASGLTYFLLGGLSSCFMLLGSALLYANSGVTNLDNMYTIYSMSEESLLWYNPFFMDLGFVILLVGFLFKMSAAPFHFWSPDVYDGVPTVVTTYMAIMPKVAIIGLFMDLISHMECIAYSWKMIFILSSFLSFIMGSVLGLTQYSIKSLFAYSTMSHMGFILLGLCTDSMESMQASMFYMLQYTMSNLNAFLMLLSIGFFLYLYTYQKQNDNNTMRDSLVDENNSPMQLMTQMKGYFYMNSFLSMSLAITLFSFVGVPPMAGFFAKQMMLSAALDKNFIFLTIVAIITSVMGAAYYLNLIKQIFFYNSDYKKNPTTDNMSLKGYITNHSFLAESSMELDSQQKESFMYFKLENMTMNGGLSSAISAITLLLLLFMFIPEEWFNMVSVLTMTLYKH